MPQMSPLLWLNLMCGVLVLFLVFFCLTYYLSLPPRGLEVTSKSSVNSKIWKW